MKVNESNVVVNETVNVHESSQKSVIIDRSTSIQTIVNIYIIDC